jgi:hypothetical protein
MEVMVSLPVIKADLRFEYLDLAVRLIADFSDLDGSEQIKFVRKDGRWRWAFGPYCSVHAIASRIFHYQENPSKQEMEFMGDYVDDLGRMLDAALEAMQEGTRTRMQAAKVAKERVVAMQKQELQPINAPIQFQKTFLYLMRHTNGLTKIGRSKNPQKREKTLQAEDPRLEMIFHCEANEFVERRLHKIFDSVRVRGEWFNLLPHHVEWIVFVLTSMCRHSI